jgi:tetratricopeptide (TPR) repeat protein
LVVLGLIAIGIAIPFYLDFLESKATENEYRRLIDEGFTALDIPDEEGLDLAIRQGLEAREIYPEGVEACLLLGKAYYLKNNLNRSVEELKKGLEFIEAIDFHPELYYHLGLAYSDLYKDVGSEALWKEALESFSQAAALGNHTADACFGTALLYFMRFRDNPTPRFKDRVIINLQNCQKLEAGKDGYVRGEPGSPCPHCRQPFKRISEEELFQKLLNSFLKDG